MEIATPALQTGKLRSRRHKHPSPVWVADLSLRPRPPEPMSTVQPSTSGCQVSGGGGPHLAADIFFLPSCDCGSGEGPWDEGPTGVSLARLFPQWPLTQLWGPSTSWQGLPWGDPGVPSPAVLPSPQLCSLVLQMVCERSDAFASACALARAFPLFTHRSGASRRPEKKTVTVEFFLVGQDNGPVEVSTLQVGVWKLRPCPLHPPAWAVLSPPHCLGGQDRAAAAGESWPLGPFQSLAAGSLPQGGLVLRIQFPSASVYEHLPCTRHFHVLILIIPPVYISHYPLWCTFTYVISFGPSDNPFEARQAGGNFQLSVCVWAGCQVTLPDLWL